MQKKTRIARSHLRKHRRLWGLTTKRLATLLGLRSRSHLSRIEHGKRPPKIEVAFACQVLFGVPPTEMFPHVYTRVEERVMRNIVQLHSALEQSTSLSAKRKRKLCELALKRAVENPDNSEGV